MTPGYRLRRRLLDARNLGALAGVVAFALPLCDGTTSSMFMTSATGAGVVVVITSFTLVLLAWLDKAHGVGVFSWPSCSFGGTPQPASATTGTSGTRVVTTSPLVPAAVSSASSSSTRFSRSSSSLSGTEWPGLRQQRSPVSRNTKFVWQIVAFNFKLKNLRVLVGHADNERGRLIQIISRQYLQSSESSGTPYLTAVLAGIGVNKASIGPMIEFYQQRYRHLGNIGKWRPYSMDILVDMLMVCPQRYFVDDLLNAKGSGNRVYRYLLSGEEIGIRVPSTKQLEFLFGKHLTRPGEEAAQKLSRRMIQLWTDFAKNRQLPEIEKEVYDNYSFTLSDVTDGTSRIDKSGRLDIRKEYCDFLKPHYMGSPFRLPNMSSEENKPVLAKNRAESAPLSGEAYNTASGQASPARKADDAEDQPRGVVRPFHDQHPSDTGTIHSSQAFTDSAFRRSSVYRDEAVLPALVRILQKKFGRRFQETRDIVIFVLLVVLAGLYLVISSKLMLDVLEVPGAGVTINESSHDEAADAYTYPPGCEDESGNISCLPQTTYLERHIRKGVICKDFYKAVCNDNYFYSTEGKDPTLWPYRYSSLHAITSALTRAIKDDYNDFAKRENASKEDAVYKTLYFIKNCTSESDRNKVNIGHVKRALAQLGLPSSPYSRIENSTFPAIPEVLGKVMRSANLEIFFGVDLVPTQQQATAKRIVLRKLPANHESIERRRRTRAIAQSELFYLLLKTQDFMPPHGKLYDYISQDFFVLAKEIAAERGKYTPSETTHTVQISTLPTGPPNSAGEVFNWILFFQTLFNASRPSAFPGTKRVIVRDYDFLEKIIELIQKTSQHSVLNYIVLAAWSLIAPLLPEKYLKRLPHLPNDNYVFMNSEKFLPSCVKLAEKLCPAGMAATLLTKFLKMKDFQSVVNLQSSIVDLYRRYLSEFIDGIKPGIPPSPGKSTFFNNVKATIVLKAIHVGFLKKYSSLPLNSLTCQGPIRRSGNVSEDDDTVLFYFVEGLKQISAETWDQRYTPQNTPYDEPDFSNFNFNFHFGKAEIFVPLVYVALALLNPPFKETYIMMSLYDFLKAFFRSLYYEESTSRTIVERGKEVRKYTLPLETTTWQEFIRAPALPTGAVDNPHSWLFADLIVAKFFHLLNKKFDGIAEPMVKGLPAEYKFMMKYILFTEAACRFYQGNTSILQAVYDYGLPPQQEINFAVQNDPSFNSVFSCTP
ncbi:uncharacterized protein LOC144153134 [Haemaphysalis longicornis]